MTHMGNIAAANLLLDLKKHRKRVRSDCVLEQTFLEIGKMSQFERHRIQVIPLCLQIAGLRNGILLDFR
jgi:hypothetical protein